MQMLIWLSFEIENLVSYVLIETHFMPVANLIMLWSMSFDVVKRACANCTMNCTLSFFHHNDYCMHCTFSLTARTHDRKLIRYYGPPHPNTKSFAGTTSNFKITLRQSLENASLQFLREVLR